MCAPDKRRHRAPLRIRVKALSAAIFNPQFTSFGALNETLRAWDASERVMGAMSAAGRDRRTARTPPKRRVSCHARLILSERMFWLRLARRTLTQPLAIRARGRKKDCVLLLLVLSSTSLPKLLHGPGDTTSFHSTPLLHEQVHLAFVASVSDGPAFLTFFLWLSQRRPASRVRAGPIPPPRCPGGTPYCRT